MRTLYFDCFAGVSGDMVLGALAGAGADERALVEQLRLLGVEGFDLTFERVDRAGISATRALVRAPEGHHHRHLSDILRIINESPLSEGVKNRAALVFARLAEAEARVHGIPVEQVHFHEVGALDAIVDVVGACVGFELLKVERFVCSPLHVGSGTVEMAHGRFPVPPPAVVELLKGAPVYSTEVKGELVTPTGAAIVSAVSESFGPLPSMRVAATGYGAGKREYKDFPNALRVFVGESEAAGARHPADETLMMVETNLDDATPQVIGHLMGLAFERGALDCYFTPVQMKKDRPGVLVSLLCRPADREAVFDLLFAETTTLGARAYEVTRRALERETVTVLTDYGAVEVKVARVGGQVRGGTPEYEQCRAAARAHGVPLRVVEEAVRAAFARREGE